MMKQIVGKLEDPSGNPLANFEFSVTKEPEVSSSGPSVAISEPLSVFTDENGDLDFNLLEGKYRVRFHNNLGSKEIAMVVQGDSPLQFNEIIRV